MDDDFFYHNDRQGLDGVGTLQDSILPEIDEHGYSEEDGEFIVPKMHKMMTMRLRHASSSNMFSNHQRDMTGGRF